MHKSDIRKWTSADLQSFSVLMLLWKKGGGVGEMCGYIVIQCTVCILHISDQRQSYDNFDRTQKFFGPSPQWHHNGFQFCQLGPAAKLWDIKSFGRRETKEIIAKTNFGTYNPRRSVRILSETPPWNRELASSQERSRLSLLLCWVSLGWKETYPLRVSPQENSFSSIKVSL